MNAHTLVSKDRFLPAERNRGPFDISVLLWLEVSIHGYIQFLEILNPDVVKNLRNHHQATASKPYWS